MEKPTGSQGSYQCANQHQAVAVKIQPFPTILQSLKFDDFQQTPSSRISEFLGEAPQLPDKLFFLPPPTPSPFPLHSRQSTRFQSYGGGITFESESLRQYFQ